MSSTGAIIMGLFAAIWWLVGVRASGYASPLTYGIPLIVTGLIAFVSLRFRDRFEQVTAEEHGRRGRLVGIASGVEGLAILVAVNVLAYIGRGYCAAPVIAIIVGLHFAPLAQRLPARLYYGTGALLIVLGACGFLIRRQEQRVLVVSIGAACILWLTCVVVLGGARTRRDRQSGAPAA